MGGHYLFLEKLYEKRKYTCIIYILYVCFGIPKKSLPVCHRLNCLKEIPNRERKEKKFSLKLFETQATL